MKNAQQSIFYVDAIDYNGVRGSNTSTHREKYTAAPEHAMHRTTTVTD